MSEISVIVGSVVQMTVHSVDEDVVVCRWAVGSTIREKQFYRMEIGFEEKDVVELNDAALALEMIETLTIAQARRRLERGPEFADRRDREDRSGLAVWS